MYPTVCLILYNYNNNNAMSTQLEDMSAENPTANLTWSNTTKAILNYTTKTASFFDQGWQLAITVELYFRYAVIAIGVFGTAANALVLYALITHNVREAKKRAINLLIIHQNLLDLSCCVLLVITHSIADKIYLTGALGYFLCTFFVSEGATYCALYASVVNLMSLTIERYLKIVHPFWSKKYLKRWMIHTAMAFAWITGVMFVMPVVFYTSLVKDGYCLSYFIWDSPTIRMMYGASTIFSFFALPLIIFIYCYGRIVVVMKRQMRVMAGHNEASSQMNASQMHSKRIKWNIIKTMITVSVAFIICWFPSNIYFMIVDNTAQTSILFVGYYPTIFMAYLNICMNPFIYAAKHEGVKQKLAPLMMCLKCNRPSAVMDNSGSGSRPNNAGVTPATQQRMAAVACS